MGLFNRLIARLDRFQQRHAVLGFPLAVRQKFADDQGGFLAASVTYYAFFSIFPLLLVLVTLLGYALQGDPDLQRRVLDSALADFPGDRPAAQDNVHSLRGSAPALAVGIGVAVWAGTGVALAIENALDHIWGVPIRRRANPLLRACARSSGSPRSAASRSSARCSARPARSHLWPGRARRGRGRLAGDQHRGLPRGLPRAHEPQPIVARRAARRARRRGRLGDAADRGGYIVDRQLRHASSTYGVFAIVIGLLSWLYLAANVTLLSAEINVVRSAPAVAAQLLAAQRAAAHRGRRAMRCASAPASRSAARTRTSA